jgi:hypothetical protein
VELAIGCAADALAASANAPIAESLVLAKSIGWLCALRDVLAVGGVLAIGCNSGVSGGAARGHAAHKVPTNAAVAAKTTTRVLVRMCRVHHGEATAM